MSGPQEFDDQDQTLHNHNQSQQGFGQQDQSQQQFAPPGYPQPGYAPQRPPRQKSQVGRRLAAFVLRDVPALVAAGITIVMGLLLLIAPSLAWVKDNSLDLVDGTMTVSARGSIGLSSAAQRGLSNSDALDLGNFEIMLRTMLDPLAGMLTLSAVLILLGGVLMLTTARQLGAVVAIMGVIPQIIIAAVTTLTMVITDDSPPSSEPSNLTSGVSAGAGLYVTVVAYVIVLICVAVVALRREGPPSFAATTPGPAFQPPAGPSAQYPAAQPETQQQSQHYGPEGQPPTGS